MTCKVNQTITLVPSEMKGDDGRVYSGNAQDIVNQTKILFRTLSLDVEHNRKAQVGFINTSSLIVKDGSIFGLATYFDGYDESNFKGLSPTLLTSDTLEVVAIGALTLTDNPNFNSLTFKEIDMAKTEQTEIEQLKEANAKLLATLVEHRNMTRTIKINEMVEKDSNLDLFRGDLLAKDDSAFEDIFSKVVSTSTSGLIEQDNSRAKTTDKTGEAILKELGVEF